MKVELEDDAVPIVRITGQKIRKALETPATLMAVRGLTGAFGLISTTDPQSLTVELRGDSVYLHRGVASNTLIDIRLDFNSDAKPAID
ncbi:MAG: hypothetical protein KDI36_04085, partial [Pseudomonadales bacterium]|nr:hypothetical protein [Pseudomonadales bacterium]